MEELLKTMIGKEVELTCGHSTGFRGEATALVGGVLSLKDKDGKITYIAADTVIAVKEADNETTRPGFVG